ncbi:MAG: hypothetical protein ACOX25_02525 [Caldicoprobacterales bacterium]
MTDLGRWVLPEDLIQVIAEPSIGLTNELMAQVDRILATGGGAMVKAANSSGTPAFGVGPRQLLPDCCRGRRH